MPFFSNKFKRQKNPEGSYQYWFQTCYTQNESNRNERPPLAVDGETLDSEILSSQDESRVFMRLPEETENPSVLKKVFEQWIQDCSQAFVKPPSIEQCLINCQSIWDSNAPIATLEETEESSNWILQWIPTKIKVDAPTFQVYWAPSFKVEATRIPEIKDESHNIMINLKSKDIELQTHEDTTRVIRAKDGSDWLQEMNGDALPLSDSPALRLDIDTQREKYRRRVKEARIRAKLAHYRAERLAQRYEERYGMYPDEDEEEAQTEVEQSEED